MRRLCSDDGAKTSARCLWYSPQLEGRVFFRHCVSCNDRKHFTFFCSASSSELRGAHVCKYCDLAFMDSIMYTIHMGYHGFQDPFKCNICGDQTDDKVSFFLHIARKPHN